MEDMRQELRRLRHELQKVKTRQLERVHVAEAVYNLKGWDSYAGQDMTSFLHHSKASPLLRSLPRERIVCALEEPGTVLGSGAAILNTLRHCSFMKGGHQDASLEEEERMDEPGAVLALLMAGEGSRLWGISAAMGFVKGLTNILGTTLVEQTVNQLVGILAQAPNKGMDMVMVAGTDNVLLPSRPLRIPATSSFLDRETGKHQNQDNGLFFFSKKVPVLNENGEPVTETILEELSQLGIMLVDPKTSYPFLFLEKIPPQQILSVLQAHKQTHIYFNVFYFLFRKQAARVLVESFDSKFYALNSRGQRHGQPSLSEFFEANKIEFDWSSHFIEPLILGDEKAWEAKWQNNEKGIQQTFRHSKQHWMKLFEVAAEFQRAFGRAVVVDVGEDAIWFDTGMASDMRKLYDLAVVPSGAPNRKNALEMRELICGLFQVPSSTDVYNCTGVEDKLKLPSGEHSFLIVNSVFKNGGSVGHGSIIVNSIFEEEVHIPEDSLIINSHIYHIDPQSEPRSMAYSYNSTAPLQLLGECVHYSVFMKQKAGGGEDQRQRPLITSGAFPAKVNPKSKAQGK
ncbi:hypothetical protein QOT17_023831, partial [Balamuthia mandrillaris]